MSWQSACIVAACTSSIELTCPRTCGEREGALESVLALRVGIARATSGSKYALPPGPGAAAREVAQENPADSEATC
jgi:hypothetical protein